MSAARNTKATRATEKSVVNARVRKNGSDKTSVTIVALSRPSLRTVHGMASRPTVIVICEAAMTSPRLPLIPKLSPNVPNVALFAKLAEDEGADAISLINTLPAMVIDVDTRRPVLSNVVGGLSGPGIKPVAIKQVWEAAKAVSIPVIGMGGVTCARDALEFMIAGASAVAVGTANFTEPTASVDVIEGIAAYLAEHGIADVHELIGSVNDAV